MSSTRSFQQIFDYLTAIKSEPLEPADGAFVFCRADRRLADIAALLYQAELAPYILLTGGRGKDSGDLTVPEAHYIASLLLERGVPERAIVVEPWASNGAENSLLGMKAILANGLPHTKMILVAHATSLRRLWATHLLKDAELGFGASYQLQPTLYNFRPHSAADRKEAIGELLRLADWPAKGWATAQADLPQDLVDFARSFVVR